MRDPTTASSLAGKSRLLGSDVPLECGLCRSYFRLHRWSQPEFCSGQRRVCFFLEFLRTRVRRAHRPQLLCRQDHVHKRLRDLSCFLRLLLLSITFLKKKGPPPLPHCRLKKALNTTSTTYGIPCWMFCDTLRLVLCLEHSSTK